MPLQEYQFVLFFGILFGVLIGGYITRAAIKSPFRELDDILENPRQGFIHFGLMFTLSSSVVALVVLYVKDLIFPIWFLSLAWVFLFVFTYLERLSHKREIQDDAREKLEKQIHRTAVENEDMTVKEFEEQHIDNEKFN